MAKLAFVGPGTVVDTGLVTGGLLSSLLSGNITQSQMTNLITSGFAPCATTTYVDEHDLLLATPSFVDDEEAKRLAKANLNVAGYPFTLDANGKIPAAITGLNTKLQRYPKMSVGSAGGTATTTSMATIGNLIPVAAPGYDYKLLVFGTVHAGVGTDGAYPSVTVVRADGSVVGSGVGVGETYTAPAVNSQSSQMYLKSAYTLTANNTWTTLPGWAAVNTLAYGTTINSNGIQIAKSMTGATLAATVAFSGAAPPMLGGTTSQIRIFCLTTNTVVATSPAISLGYNVLTSNSASGTCTVSATANVTAGQIYVVQALTNNGQGVPFGVYDPLLNKGALATWSGGTGNTFTITAPTATTPPTGEIPIIPQITTQTTISGSLSTTVSVRLQSSGATVSTAYYNPLIWVVPIPA